MTNIFEQQHSPIKSNFQNTFDVTHAKNVVANFELSAATNTIAQIIHIR